MGQAQLKGGSKEQDYFVSAIYFATLKQANHTFSILDKSFKMVNTVASDMT